MEWQEDGILLASRPHGESAAIIEVFTETHGRHAGVVRGGAGRKLAPVLQPGAHMSLTWRARLDDHIGTFSVEPLRGRAAMLMSDRTALAGLSAVCSLLVFSLPERAAFPELYIRSNQLMDLMAVTPAWSLAYLQWELLLLEEMGFGLDLETCAVTGTTEDLAYISPRTGRAVTAAAAGEWTDKLFVLEPCLVGAGDATDPEIARALTVTGHFLEQNLPRRYQGQSFPAARGRLIDRLARQF